MINRITRIIVVYANSASVADVVCSGGVIALKDTAADIQRRAVGVHSSSGLSMIIKEFTVGYAHKYIVLGHHSAAFGRRRRRNSRQIVGEVPAEA